VVPVTVVSNVPDCWLLHQPGPRCRPWHGNLDDSTSVESTTHIHGGTTSEASATASW